MKTSTVQNIPNYSTYELLRVYTYYRTLLGSLLLLMFQGQVAPSILGYENPDLFFYTSAIYTALNVVTLGLLWRAKFLPSVQQLFVLLLIDLLAVGLLMHASGGAQSGLGYLLLVVVAAGGMLLPGQLAVLLAALASIAVLGESISRIWLLSADYQILFSSGALGALLFFTAIAFQYLTKKVRTTHEEAQSQAEQAAHLQKLAQLIVERMRTGILVLNPNQHIDLFNKSAANLLAIPTTKQADLTLADLPELQEHLQQWRQHASPLPPVRVGADTASEVKINFAPLGEDDQSDILIFVEDNRLITQQAQQLKLASLGRLTASIAHEIRNPLGAISHASQLLAESENLESDDLHLLSIIDNHSKRVNQIIENVLQLSRRRTATPQQVDLDLWLPKFISDYSTESGQQDDIELRLLSSNIIAKFDPGQLHQVLSNLCDNGRRYSKLAIGKSRVKLEAGIEKQAQQPYIRVIDWGKGIDKQERKHVFEPFYTTSNTGSGLGLYICKELCEANQAFIHYTRTKEGLSCFHIQLAHPDRAL
ncbi:PAS domain-containing sensor histidine kinase [Marinimicrobium sp. ABcell2]|uniref:sensor histidine kinase n=1 Tax=Marinimicrobium sp. ABcell2 TaxID=3069751 RepID=UPI0027B26ABA|nr:HAMP domain-containing sensor histidine kinase [Marinimicrobium sp. ABcell2]MDQ2078118.1 HAMP domain-containing sensor histidine kinase [Marinimicrobium sp. ABcell2]